MSTRRRLLVASYLVTGGQVPERAFELRALIVAGSEGFDDCRAVGFDDLTIITGPDSRFTIVVGSEPLERVDALIVRGTGEHLAGAAALAEVVEAGGGIVLDGLTRFNAAANNKTTTTVSRHRRGVGGPSMLIFGTQKPSDLVAIAAARLGTDLVSKPVGGRGGAGVRQIHGPVELETEITRELGLGHSPLLIQKRLEIASEFRVIKLYDQVLGVAERVAADGAVAANVAQGGTLVQPSHGEDVAMRTYAAERLPNDGLIGADIARTHDGGIVLIEENYAPSWVAFEQTLGINVAEQVIKSLATRLDGPERPTLQASTRQPEYPASLDSVGS